MLVLAQMTATSAALREAVRERAERGPCRFHLLVPNPARPEWHPLHPERAHSLREAEGVIARALPELARSVNAPVQGSLSLRQDPMDAIEEALRDGDYDEIILSIPPHPISRWLHLDLPRRVEHLGLPTTWVSAERAPEEH